MHVSLTRVRCLDMKTPTTPRLTTADRKRATLLASVLTANSTAFCADTITYESFTATQRATCWGSAIRQAPKRPFCTFSLGQPTLRLISS